MAESVRLYGDESSRGSSDDDVTSMRSGDRWLLIFPESRVGF
jgi:hypothetical protein